MEAVVKVGGSLEKEVATLKRICQELSCLAETHRVVLVPGGGEFADTIRKLDKKFNLSNTVAHKMAILAMDQYGLLLSNIAPNSYISHSIEEIKNSTGRMLPIFLPSTHMFREDPLEHTWDITSDSISAYIARLLHAEKLVLVTDVDGIFSDNPKKNLNATLIEELPALSLLNKNRRTSVDKALPKLLLQARLDCYVVNGRYPERIKLILENKKTVHTRITL
jgi:aspartokinase-like uncharacterized kinase